MRRQTRIWLILLLVVVIAIRAFLKQSINNTENDMIDNAQDLELQTDIEVIENRVAVNVPERPVAEVEDTQGEVAPVVTDSTTYSLAPASLSNWLVRRVEGDFDSTVAITDGDLQIKDGEVVGGKLTFDLSSMSMSEGADEEFASTIRGQAFLDVNSYPTATLDIVEVQEGSIKGILTIKGVSKVVTFPATVIVEDDIVAINAEFAIDRTQWGIQGGEEIVSDYIEITLRLTWTS